MLGRIKRVIVHGIGSKTLSERVQLSENEVVFSEGMKSSLASSLSKAKFTEATYQFFHESGELELNAMFVFANRVLCCDEPFVETSYNIARHLYESSDHPKIKAGVLIVVLFEDCEYHGQRCKALGLFKSESREKFYDIYYNHGSYSMIEKEGMNAGSLEKGAIIYDVDKDEGYRISILMQASKQVDVKYWMNDFLHVTQTSDSFFKTQQIVSLTKDYVKEVLVNEESLTKIEQSEMLTRAVGYLSENKTFDSISYGKEVFRDETLADNFLKYGCGIESGEIDLSEPFELDKSVIKKHTRNLKSVIKLDKNFHIYVHGGEGMIKKGFDEVSGLEYYQLYFKKEE